MAIFKCLKVLKRRYLACKQPTQAHRTATTRASHKQRDARVGCTKGTTHASLGSQRCTRPAWNTRQWGWCLPAAIKIICNWGFHSPKNQCWGFYPPKDRSRGFCSLTGQHWGFYFPSNLRTCPVYASRTLCEAKEHTNKMQVIPGSRSST